MSVLIKGIKKPNCCAYCIGIDESGRYNSKCTFTPHNYKPIEDYNIRPAWCPLVEADDGESQWIPVEYHETTEEERRENDYPADWVFYIDSPMPDEGQEILITTNAGYVEKDTCLYDGDTYYTDSGYDWCGDIAAWMPLPEPYKKDGEPSDIQLDKRGKWILIDKNYMERDGWEYHRYKCNVCSYATVEPDNYCPHCGSDMRGEMNG